MPNRGGSTKKKKKGSSSSARVIAPAVIFVLLVLGAFIFLNLTTHAGKQQAVCGLVIDRSSSTSGAQANYEQAAKAAVAGCAAANASLSVWYFSNSGNKVQALNGDQPYQLWGPGKRSAELKQQAIASADADISSMVFGSGNSSKGNHGSDIITPINTAVANLNLSAQQAGVARKFLVVVTDGIQIDDNTVNLNGYASSSDAPEPIIEGLKTNGLVPMSDGVQYSFAGVGQGIDAQTGKTLPASYEAQLKRFWLSFVQTSGGKTCVYEPSVVSLPVSC